MDYRDKIIAEFAERECKRIAQKVIRQLKSMTDGMQSGQDTPLANIWDEICVQVQGEESVMWEAYLDDTLALITIEATALEPMAKTAIWLQTDQGFEWSVGHEDQETSTFCEEDIAQHILDTFVLSAAADWTNKRIRQYLERESD
jgi:hypothetical protein